MRFNSDALFATSLISAFVLAGLGLSKLFDYVQLPSSTIWPAIVLIIIGVVTWMIYMIQTDGFDAKKAQNDAKVAEFKSQQRAIEARRVN
jgi:hypothetical protein